MLYPMSRAFNLWKISSKIFNFYSLKLLEIKLESILVYNSLNPVENVKHYDRENRLYININNMNN